MPTLDDVAAIALSLPEVTEGDGGGSRTWSVAGKTFAWERQFSKADIRRYGDATPPDDPILAVRVANLDETDAILAIDRQGFFTIPHFDGYAGVLIELAVVAPEDLDDAIRGAWLACAPRKLAEAAALARRA